MIHLGPLSAARGLPPVLFNMVNWQKVDTVTKATPQVKCVLYNIYNVCI